ncbi:hypothetical protein SAMN00768000_3088 [Sulfobacillus thermosulfidooxidans DSM 9293]|uniref:Uncharacterized protein n=2 Tax=Sulfobacillus thermosulfidooxidans TaxID=28034 RepID=A0A1W1WLJ8_SULTA|nr:hypothetical protein [Sulfobacillus thermosulfidooxidans]PSR21709.1 MAG: hypothetical protein C7B47_17145 [Sulfobacillus thermosulfidooxidans]SMC06900.1 hypothetical protein SAMN00768000_3088 [Sulfobacillus thermosulfidooxidans DSM 9293]
MNQVKVSPRLQKAGLIGIIALGAAWLGTAGWFGHRAITQPKTVAAPVLPAKPADISYNFGPGTSVAKVPLIVMWQSNARLPMIRFIPAHDTRMLADPCGIGHTATTCSLEYVPNTNPIYQLLSAPKGKAVVVSVIPIAPMRELVR